LTVLVVDPEARKIAAELGRAGVSCLAAAFLTSV
jgi:hypothetical protein